MQAQSFPSHADILDMKDLMLQGGKGNEGVLFEEALQSEAVRATVKTWKSNRSLIAFAYVDDYANLCFSISPGFESTEVEDEIIAWGVRCMQARNAQNHEARTLDASCSAQDDRRIQLFKRSGFLEGNQRSLDFSRSLIDPIPVYPLQGEFTIRPAAGEGEVGALVELHRAAFGTQEMTIDQRLAIMRTSQYAPELDLLVEEDRTKRLAAFCICEIEVRPNGIRIGHPDPIGTHPEFQGHGLASALLSAGLQTMREKGAIRAESGTSSENRRMQNLFLKMGFTRTAEHLWFSKHVH
jgi:mycothiol synthase